MRETEVDREKYPSIELSDKELLEHNLIRNGYYAKFTQELAKTDIHMNETITLEEFNAKDKSKSPKKKAVKATSKAH